MNLCNEQIENGVVQIDKPSRNGDSTEVRHGQLYCRPSRWACLFVGVRVNEMERNDLLESGHCECCFCVRNLGLVPIHELALVRMMTE